MITASPVAKIGMAVVGVAPASWSHRAAGYPPFVQVWDAKTSTVMGVS
jgi:hypothetical protein